MGKTPMPPQYEYEFVRLENRITGGPSVVAIEGYQGTVHQYAAEGWRLVQIFAPATKLGVSFWELIFERPVTAEPE